MGQRALLRARLGQKVVVDILWLTWMLVAITIFVWLGTFIDVNPILAMKGVIGAVILLTGTFFSFLLVGLHFDWFFSDQEWGSFLSSLVVSLIVILFVNIITPPLSVTPIPDSLFVLLIGIAEEAFFRGFLLSGLQVITKGNSLIAIGVSSYIGAVYHTATYGLSNQLMMIVFGCFCVLGAVYLLSGRRLSVPMTAHACINLFAYIGGG